MSGPGTGIGAGIEQRFHDAFGQPPAGVWAGPGRVNLIGEHVDYNDGLVLPLAIGRRALVAAAARNDGLVRIRSAQVPGVVEARIGTAAHDGWAAYVLGVAWALGEAGIDVPGFELLLDSDIPLGSGLSSSAAVETATALALCHLAGRELSPMELAQHCHRAETGFVGAPVGMMDQVASACAVEGHALLLDCRSHEVTQVPFALPDVTLLVIDTRVRHANTDGAYAERRAACEKAADALGLVSLRDAGLGQVVALPDGLRQRARHVVSEIARVTEAVTALRAADTARLGELLVQSHQSLRDDFAVSCEQLDLAVDTALATGALGARLTGAGFGGCVIALVPDEHVATVTTAVLQAFAFAGHATPDVFTEHAGAGAARIR